MNSTFSDNSLMNKVKEGDLDKLGLLFERYKRMLFSYFYGMNKDAELSEDLVQNTFMRVLKYRKAFKGDGQFKHWIFHIARNVNFDHYKKNKMKFSVDIDNYRDSLSEGATAESDMVEQEDRDRLQKALQMLDPDKREVIVLSKIEGMKYAEIGALMEISEGTVKVRVFRAMQDLKQLLNPESQNYYLKKIK